MSINKLIADKIDESEKHKLNVMSHNLVEQNFKNSAITYKRENPSSNFYNTDEMGIGPFFKNISQLISEEHYDKLQSE